MRLDAADRRAIADIVHVAGSFDDIERPAPALDAIVPMLQRLLRSEFGVAYRVERLPDEKGWHVEKMIVHAEDGSAPFTEPFRQFIAHMPGTFAWYDAAHPEPDQQNVVRIPSQELSERELLESPIIQKVFAPGGLERYDQMRALLCDGPALMAWFGGIGRERFTARERAALRALVPSVRTRLLLERRLAKVDLLERGLVAALEALPCAAYVVASTGALVHANPVGRDLLDHGGAEMLARLRASARADAPAAPGVTCVSLRARGLPDHVLVTLSSPDADRASRLAHARERWGVTARQLEVLALVVQGDANKAIAEKLRCALVTVEAHVTALLTKAHVESRTELVAKFWTTF